MHEFILLICAQICVIALGALIAWSIYDEFSSRYRMWHVANLRKLADSRYYCGLLAKALDIPNDEGDAEDYVRFALRAAADNED